MEVEQGVVLGEGLVVLFEGVPEIVCVELGDPGEVDAEPGFAEGLAPAEGETFVTQG